MIQNPNPKGDAFLVLMIMIELEGKQTLDRNWVLDRISEVNLAKEPYKLLKGEAYTRFLTLKEKPRYQKTED